MSSKDFKVICNKCGKTAPVDEASSNENWIVYKVDKPCECGGSFVPEFMIKGASEC